MIAFRIVYVLQSNEVLLSTERFNDGLGNQMAYRFILLLLLIIACGQCACVHAYG